MKKIISTIISASMILSSASIFAADDDIKVYLNGQQLQFEVAPIIVDGTTLVPMRTIFEALGAYVEWDGDRHMVSAYFPGMFLYLTINSNIIEKNAIPFEVDVAPMLYNGNTLVPLRFISEAVGSEVLWDGSNRSIHIGPAEETHYIDWNDNYIYVGQAKDNEPIGYGMLKRKSDNGIVCAGTFDGQNIIEGIWLYENGDYFKGSFENSNIAYGEYYHADAKQSCTGNWTGGAVNGTAYIYDYKTGESYTADYINGVVDTPLSRAQAKYDELSKDLEYWQNEALKLYEWAGEERKKLSEYANSDMFTTEEAKSIYEMYGISGDAPSTAIDPNIDSFSASNMARQDAETRAKANKAIIETRNTHIAAWQKTIEDTYNAQSAFIKTQIDNIQNQMNELRLIISTYIN